MSLRSAVPAVPRGGGLGTRRVVIGGIGLAFGATVLEACQLLEDAFFFLFFFSFDGGLAGGDLLASLCALGEG